MIIRRTTLDFSTTSPLLAMCCYVSVFLHKSIIMARRNSFYFAHTCPKIDKAIAAAKHTIQSYLKDYINDLCPYIPDEKAIELSNDWGETIYNDISDCFESVRETNEDMRREADSQIDRLADEISDLNEQIKNLEHQLEVVS